MSLSKTSTINCPETGSLIPPEFSKYLFGWVISSTFESSSDTVSNKENKTKRYKDGSGRGKEVLTGHWEE